VDSGGGGRKKGVRGIYLQVDLEVENSRLTIEGEALARRERDYKSLCKMVIQIRESRAHTGKLEYHVSVRTGQGRIRWNHRLRTSQKDMNLIDGKGENVGGEGSARLDSRPEEKRTRNGSR